MTQLYDTIIIGSGPGGYIAAVKAAQCGMRVAVIEKENPGGVCLNYGCIPTKALLQSAKLYEQIKQASCYGIHVDDLSLDFPAIIQRSRDVVLKMRSGVEHLFKKYNIDLIRGHGRLSNQGGVDVLGEDQVTTNYQAEHIILATGSKSKNLPHIHIDGEHVMGYRDVLTRRTQPKVLTIIGGGAIGCEFAYFYAALGTKVNIVEYNEFILGQEDLDISKYLTSYFKKVGINIYTSTRILGMEVQHGETLLRIQKEGENTILKSDCILMAVGIEPNIEEINLQAHHIQLKQGKIAVDPYYQTSKRGIYAIGDIIPGPALAHVASMEAIICVEHIVGKRPDPLDYNNIPSCIYTSPEVASVGYHEKSAKEAGYDIKIGIAPLLYSGKAHAMGKKEGFIKVIFDAKYGQCLGAHMIGEGVTEMIAEIVVARKLETTAYEMQYSIHPHPTLSESIVEAVSAAYSQAIHVP